ncbi:MAG: PAS domain-containing protein [Alphaproteobacteria bacterium]|nr:PAS domain-containing protein [Alphaproteobacteria bacterium]
MISTLSESDAISLRVLDAVPFAVLAIGRRDLVTFVNPAAETLFARSAPLMRGRPLSDVLSPDAPLFDFISRARREGGVLSARGVRLASPHITPVAVDISAAPDGEEGGLVLTFTPARSAQEENNAEVTAVAQVARMLGHEVKNPLAGIVGAAQLLARQATSEQQPLLSLIREEGARIERIVDRFAAFETFFAPRTRPTNVHVVIDSVVELAKASFAANSRVDLLYDPSLPEIEVDPDHLHEACLNIVKNAVEAAGQGASKPRISIATRYRAGFRFAGRDGPRARGALEISVQDNGPGVPESAISRIFEPFYTTKSGGAGVGLAVVAEIMSAHGGFVVLDNSPRGACLRLLFPFARKKGSIR